MAFLAPKSETELDFKNEKFLDVSSRWEAVVDTYQNRGKTLRALSIFGSYGVSKEWNVLDLSRAPRGILILVWGASDPPGGHISRNRPALGGFFT